MTISEFPTAAEIATTLRKLEMDTASPDSVSQDAIACIQFLQTGVACAEAEVRLKRRTIDVLTEGNGVADDVLWAAMKKERDEERLRADKAMELLAEWLSIHDTPCRLDHHGRLTVDDFIPLHGHGMPRTIIP